MNKLLFTTILLASIGLYAREDKENKQEEAPSDRQNADHPGIPDHSKPESRNRENNKRPSPRNTR